jgi:hypothetical protein
MLYLSPVEKELSEAAVDYLYLLERGYTRSVALKTVSNRYGLDKDRQMAIYRSIHPLKLSLKVHRKSLKSSELSRHRLGIDWYNVFITVNSGLTDNPLYLGTDGFIRDIRGIHGKINMLSETDITIECITKYLQKSKPRGVKVFLEKNISWSGEMKQRISNVFFNYDIQVDSILLTKTVDKDMISEELVIASSDSVLLNKACRVFDLARAALDNYEGNIILYYFPIVATYPALWI